MNPLLLLLVAAGSIVAALPWARKRAAARKLHNTLCEQSGLSADENAWLWGLAVSTRLVDPAEVFVRPSLFEGRGDDGAPASEVRRKLFGA